MLIIYFARLILPTSSPRWQKNQLDIKMYLSGLVQVCFVCVCVFFNVLVTWLHFTMLISALKSDFSQLLSSLTQSTVITAVLRHANQMVPYFLCVPKQSRHFLKVRVQY